jgi:hypothetical protein
MSDRPPFLIGQRISITVIHSGQKTHALSGMSSEGNVLWQRLSDSRMGRVCQRHMLTFVQ